MWSKTLPPLPYTEVIRSGRGGQEGSRTSMKSGGTTMLRILLMRAPLRSRSVCVVAERDGEAFTSNQVKGWAFKMRGSPR